MIFRIGILNEIFEPSCLRFLKLSGRQVSGIYNIATKSQRLQVITKN